MVCVWWGGGGDKGIEAPGALLFEGGGGVSFLFSFSFFFLFLFCFSPGGEEGGN